MRERAHVSACAYMRVLVCAVDDVEDDELLDRAKIKMLTDRTVRHAHAKEKRKKVRKSAPRREDDEPTRPATLLQTTTS